MNLTFKKVAAAHIERQQEWDPNKEITPLFRAVELAGEAGEAANQVKKLERERLGLRGSRGSKEKLAEELADTIHCAILIANDMEIDIESALIDKFNATSEANDFETRLRA